MIRTLSFVIICLITSFFTVVNNIHVLFKDRKDISDTINKWYSCIFYILVNFYNVNLYITYDFFEFINDKSDFVMISNHISEIDYIFLLSIQSFRDKKICIVLKNALRYIFGGLGWACWLNDFIFVKRNFDKDKNYIENKLKQEDNKNVLIFPEGTIFCDSTIMRNMNYCLQNEILPFQYVLNPKTKGCELIQENISSKTVYDVTLLYDKMPYVKRKLDYTIKNIVNHDLLPYNVFINIEKLDCILKDDLYGIFERKDEFIKNFNKNKNINHIKLGTNKKDLLNTIFIILNSMMGMYLFYVSNFYRYYVFFYTVCIYTFMFIDDKFKLF